MLEGFFFSYLFFGLIHFNKIIFFKKEEKDNSWGQAMSRKDGE